jgi:hypothetical protein
LSGGALSRDHPLFPNLPVVIFPGNVGDDDALATSTGASRSLFRRFWLPPPPLRGSEYNGARARIGHRRRGGI